MLRPNWHARLWLTRLALCSLLPILSLLSLRHCQLILSLQVLLMLLVQGLTWLVHCLTPLLILVHIRLCRRSRGLRRSRS